MPDIVIWMISGSKRIAYHRLPAHEVMYSQNPLAKGKDCSRPQNITLKVSLFCVLLTPIKIV